MALNPQIFSLNRIQAPSLPQVPWTNATEEQNQQNLAQQNRYKYQQDILGAEEKKANAQIQGIQNRPTTLDAVNSAVQGLGEGINQYQDYKTKETANKLSEEQIKSASFKNKMDQEFGRRQMEANTGLSEEQRIGAQETNAYNKQANPLALQEAKQKVEKGGIDLDITKKYGDKSAAADLAYKEGQVKYNDAQIALAGEDMKIKKLDGEAKMLQNQFDKETMKVRKDAIAAQIQANRAQAAAAAVGAQEAKQRMEIAKQDLGMRQQSFDATVKDKNIADTQQIIKSAFLAGPPNPAQYQQGVNDPRYRAEKQMYDKRMADPNAFLADIQKTKGLSPNELVVAVAAARNEIAAGSQQANMMNITLKNAEPAFQDAVKMSSEGMRKAAVFQPFIASLNNLEKQIGSMSWYNSRDAVKSDIDSKLQLIEQEAGPKAKWLIERYRNNLWKSDSDVTKVIKDMKELVVTELAPYKQILGVHPELRSSSSYIDKVSNFAGDKPMIPQEFVDGAKNFLGKYFQQQPVAKPSPTQGVRPAQLPINQRRQQ